jgi:hypothetical protein
MRNDLQQITGENFGATVDASEAGEVVLSLYDF